MARRHNHYEQALEQTLLGFGVPLVPINECEMARVNGRTLKNFDYVVYRPGQTHLLLEVKGRKVARSGSSNCWATRDDVGYLEGWRPIFGEAFEPAFAFVFELPLEDANDAHFSFGGHYYLAWLMPLTTFQALSYERSRSWGTMTMRSATFHAVAKPLLEEVISDLSPSPRREPVIPSAVSKCEL